MLFVTVFGLDKQFLIGVFFSQGEDVKGLVIVKVILLHEGDSINRIEPFVGGMRVAVFLTGMFKIIMYLGTDIGPQAVDEKFLLDNLNFDNDLGAVV